LAKYGSANELQEPVTSGKQLRVFVLNDKFELSNEQLELSLKVELNWKKVLLCCKIQK
jgi:hypothetical protein